MYFHRGLEKKLIEALTQFPVCLMTGPRQAGKSTLLQHTLKKFKYITLDNPTVRALANEDPEFFLSQNPAPLIIDEIQYAPGLFSYLKIEVDKKRGTYGQYVLTGSQTFQLMKNVSDSLAGRIAIFHLYPFSWEEVRHIPNHQAIDDKSLGTQIVQGFYPESFSNPSFNKNLWYGSYLATYIERDVRNIKSITDLGRFQTFIKLLAARAGKLLNLSEVAKECGITQPTAKDWLSVLESTYIIYILKPYHSNLSKRLVKSPKVYFIDTGLLCYLLGIDDGERFFKSSERGSIFENMVIIDSLKQLSLQTTLSECYFYRTASGVEVDLVIVKEGDLYAYEIKLAKTLNRSMAHPLNLFRKDYSLKQAGIISLQEQTSWIAEGIETLHWSAQKI